MSRCMTIYTKPGCQRCAATKRAATKVGITPIMVDVATDQDAAAEFLGPGRPAWLPPVPDLIRPDVEAARRLPPTTP